MWNGYNLCFSIKQHIYPSKVNISYTYDDIFTTSTGTKQKVLLFLGKYFKQELFVFLEILNSKHKRS